MSDRSEMEKVINSCNDHLYTYTPKPGDRRYVFNDKTCLTLREAYEHAVHSNTVANAKKELSHD